MHNTIDNNKPIYDGEVSKVFLFRKPTTDNFDKKLGNYLQQINTIENTYNLILQEKSIEETTELSKTFD